MQTLEQRVESLERSNRRWRCGAVLAVLTAACVAAAKPGNTITDLTRSRRLEVLNNDGAIVAVVGPNEDGCGDFRLFDAQGKQGVLLAAASDTPALLLSHKDGSDAFGVLAFNGKASLNLSNAGKGDSTFISGSDISLASAHGGTLEIENTSDGMTAEVSENAVRIKRTGRSIVAMLVDEGKGNIEVTDAGATTFSGIWPNFVSIGGNGRDVPPFSVAVRDGAATLKVLDSNTHVSTFITGTTVGIHSEVLAERGALDGVSIERRNDGRGIVRAMNPNGTDAAQMGSNKTGGFVTVADPRGRPKSGLDTR